jgi:phosphoribosylglycinamide formyltransferase-1
VLSIAAVFSNKAHAFGIQRAKAAGVAAHVPDANAYQDRTAFAAALVDSIDQYHPDLVVLAGYMRIINLQLSAALCWTHAEYHSSFIAKIP